MKEFDVIIKRVSSETATVKVQAESEDEAEQKVLDGVGDIPGHVWQEKSGVELSIENVDVWKDEDYERLGCKKPPTT